MVGTAVSCKGGLELPGPCVVSREARWPFARLDKKAKGSERMNWRNKFQEQTPSRKPCQSDPEVTLKLKGHKRGRQWLLLLLFARLRQCGESDHGRKLVLDSLGLSQTAASPGQRRGSLDVQEQRHWPRRKGSLGGSHTDQAGGHHRTSKVGRWRPGTSSLTGSCPP